MAGFIRHISRSDPEHRYSQEQVREAMKARVAENKLQQRLIDRIYTQSGIDTRYSVLANFLSAPDAELYESHRPAPAGTAERNRIYEKRGRELFLRTGHRILEQNGLTPDQITHVVTISCTGFYAPGPDFDLIRNLGLNPGTERYHLGFMGCYASISGLRLASRICRTNPRANVMVIATELCSLHFQQASGPDSLISAALFADGSAGTVVTAEIPDKGPFLKLRGFKSALTDGGAEHMTWSIGDTGFEMILSTYVPDLLSSQLPAMLDPLLEEFELSRSMIGEWAIHPGGRRILDQLQKQLGLNRGALHHSREVLRRFGNMSSVTSLVVLQQILEQTDMNRTSSNVLSLAFGPGLTIECGWMEYLSTPESNR